MKIKNFKVAVVALFIVVLGLTGCSTMMTPAINTTDLKTTDFSGTMKKGESCQTYLFGFIGPFGDASVVKATKNADISKVEVVDYKHSNFIILAQNCVVVYGQ